jgi:hypothetical protein
MRKNSNFFHMFLPQQFENDLYGQKSLKLQHQQRFLYRPAVNRTFLFVKKSDGSSARS